MADVCISTVADRHALHFVYYSAMKKTVFDLTKRIFARGDAHRNVNYHARARHEDVRRERALHSCTQIADIAKSPV
jgi:hypothetical protein